MNAWSDGYVSDVNYNFGYYRELAPTIQEFATVVAGVAAKSHGKGGFRYCELGCGQGFSANILAAANPSAEFHAVDFNPAHVAGARLLAKRAGTTNVSFHECAFKDLNDEPELTRPFDIIALHGVYSWISAENRRHIIDFVRTRLNAGGLVYVSYNALPGWAAVMPLRRLFIDQAASRSGDTASRIEHAIRFTEQFFKLNPAFVRSNPAVQERFSRVSGQERAYIAHEYFNRDWTPFYVGDVISEFSGAKLGFAGSVHLLEYIDAINITSEQQRLLAEVPDQALRETIRDYIVNQQFRRDLFVKGTIREAAVDNRGRWLGTRFALSTRVSDVPLKVTGALGEANLQAEIYAPILEALEHGACELREILSRPSFAALGLPRVMQALAILVGSGHLHPALPAEGEGARTVATRSFNRAVMERARSSADLLFLASPVTGAGIMVDRIAQLFLLADEMQHSDAVLFTWDVLKTAGQKLIVEGKPVDSDEANLTELRSQYAAFLDRRLPVLRQLGIAQSR